jgi:hypothetical protein
MSLHDFGLKEGDLVQINDEQGTYVVEIGTGRSRFLDFQEMALLIGHLDFSQLDDNQKATILIDGMIGWVYTMELDKVQ